MCLSKSMNEYFLNIVSYSNDLVKFRLFQDFHFCTASIVEEEYIATQWKKDLINESRTKDLIDLLSILTRLALYISEH